MAKSGYIRKHPPLRGGWDVGPDEYKSLGFTIGLPPNLYIPQTPPIVELAEKYELNNANYIDIESKFDVKERQFLVQSGLPNARCYVREIPPNLNAQELKEALNKKLYQRRLTSSPKAVTRVLINPNNEYAFVEFEKVKDAERFLEQKDSFELEGHTLRIRKAHTDDMIETAVGDAQSQNISSLIICNLSPDVTEQALSSIVSDYAAIEKVTIPTIPNESFSGFDNYLKDFFDTNEYNTEGQSSNKNERKLGYAIIDLQDTKLANLVMLKLRLIHGYDCRRCFPRVDQGIRKPVSVDLINDVKHCTSKEINKYSVFVDKGVEELSIADVMNLDIDISEIKKGIPPNSVCRKLRIFNVLKSDEVSEIEEVVNDMKEECNAFGRVEEAYADTLFDRLVRQIGIPVVVIFETPEDANCAQRGISGRKYKGRIVMTMLEN